MINISNPTAAFCPRRHKKQLYMIGFGPNKNKGRDNEAWNLGLERRNWPPHKLQKQQQQPKQY